MAVYFVVQAFTSVKGGMRADIPVQAQSGEQARRMAERLSHSKPAVIAFSRQEDDATGEFDDPLLIAAFGNVPDEVREMVPAP